MCRNSDHYSAFNPPHLPEYDHVPKALVGGKKHPEYGARSSRGEKLIPLSDEAQSGQKLVPLSANSRRGNNELGYGAVDAVVVASHHVVPKPIPKEVPSRAKHPEYGAGARRTGEKLIPAPVDGANEALYGAFNPPPKVEVLADPQSKKKHPEYGVSKRGRSGEKFGPYHLPVSFASHLVELFYY